MEQINRVTPQFALEQTLISKKDSYQYEISSIISNIQVLFINTIFEVFESGMDEVFGDVWIENDSNNFQGRVDLIEQYFLTVFPQLMTEIEQNTFKIALRKSEEAGLE